MNAPADGLDDLGGQEPPSDDLLAAEYMLGVLDAGPRLVVQARIVTDRPFADLVSGWERRFAPLALEVRPVDVPDRVWTRVQERLGWTPAAPESSVRRSLYFWRLTSGVAATLALALLAVDFVPRWTTPKVSEAQLARAVTTLSREDGTPGWLATVDVRHGTVLLVPVPSAPDALGRAAELWLIPPGQAPRSLGAVSIDRARTVTIPAALRADLTPKTVLAITLESPAGIPHAAPTGPIIAKGPVHL
jgi:anti-sigma-K factor RskA